MYYITKFTLLILFATLFILSGCSDDSTLRPRDFSSAPPPVSIEGITPTELSNGVRIYTVEPGKVDEDGNCLITPLTQLDRALMKFTIWNNNGEGNIVDSSYEDGFTEALSVNIRNASIGGTSIITGPYFSRMVAGMCEGEFRATKVPPTLANRPDTVRYDIFVERILD